MFTQHKATYLSEKNDKYNITDVQIFISIYTPFIKIMCIFAEGINNS